uniref:DSBA-like thioredoxin domain-containing protein n=1 Tax=Amphora coffeiformis TaxID=265554 RepID=A0A6S8HLV7_9STRA|mmetsp:Transcript_18249/g.34635  ORF Transcript_18249/g.34635 Transcript_18249/m.34635 type:complete len:142 (+) Transcript_18249:452-877(+)
MFSNWKWWPHTLKGHQFVQYGLEKHQIPSDETNKILFHAMYEEGQNISLVDTLLSIAQTHFPAWDVVDLRDYLEANKGAALVKQEIALGRRRYGISGVPFFVIGREGGTSQPYGMSGAQSPSTLLRVLEDVANEMDEDDDE